MTRLELIRIAAALRDADNIMEAIAEKSTDKEARAWATAWRNNSRMAVAIIGLKLGEPEEVRQ